MTKYMCIHHLSPGAFKHEQVCELADAAQHEDRVRGYRSFINLSEGVALCVLEAENADALRAWFEKVGLPYDEILPVELEGERGEICDVTPAGVGVE